MATDVEVEISSLLLMEPDPSCIAHNLCQKIQASEYDFNEKITFLNALIHIGFYKEALSSILDLWREYPKNFAWKPLLFLLLKLEIYPSQDLLDTVFEGAYQQNSIDELGAIKKWEVWDGRFKEAHLTAQKKKQKELQEKGAELQDRAQFLRTQRIYDEEIALLQRLSALFPKNQNIKTQLKEAESLWSKAVISKASYNKDSWLHSPKRSSKSTDPWEKQCDHWLQFILDTVQEKRNMKKKQIYHLGLFFKFIEAPHHALKVLKNLEGFAVDWLRIDIYIDSEQYILALEEISKVEKKYAEHPETSFAANYSRGIALKHLGQEPAAIEFMKKIVQVKRDYRSALQYIKDWESP